MPEKDPNTWSTASWLISGGCALAGGLISYVQEMRMTKRFDFFGFLFDMFTSTFVGIMAYWICKDVLLQPEALCAGAAGFAGNLGASVFAYLKVMLRRRMGLSDKEK